MRTTISFTGRQTLDKGSISFDMIHKTKQGMQFPVLKSFDFDCPDSISKNALIILRLKQGAIVKTIECGTVEIPSFPQETLLEDFITTELNLKITFNLIDPISRKITASNKGLIAPFKRLESNNSTLSPISIKWAPLKPKLWELDDLNEHDHKATILFDHSIDEKNSLKNDSLIRGLVLPTVLKEMLQFMINNNLVSDDDADTETWPGRINALIKIWRIDITNDFDFEDPETSEEFINSFVYYFLNNNVDVIYKKSIQKLNEGYF